MLLPWILFGFCPTFVSALRGSITARFVKDYFPSRFVNQVVAFGCWEPNGMIIKNNLEFICESTNLKMKVMKKNSESDAFQFSRFLMEDNTKISYNSIRQGLIMKKILKFQYHRLGIFLDFDCSNSEIIFEQFMDQKIRFNESYWWLIVTEQKSVPKDFFSELPLNVATEMTVALKTNESFTFYDVYNPSYNHGARLNVTFMGIWNPEDGLSIELTQYKYLRRGNLFGLTLNSSVALSFPAKPDFMTYLSTPINPGFDTMHRFNYGLIRQLQDYYNFNINLKKGSTWGYLLPNGSYSGILGDMSKGLVDISVTPFQYKMDRLDVVEYTVQTWVARVVLIFRHPQKNELSNVFLKPFEPIVWYWIAFAGFVNWGLLYFTVKVEQYYDWRKPVNTLDTNPASEVGLIAIAAICQQGLSDGPRIYSGRIVFMFLFLWALLMFQFYSASIVGSLLMEKPRYILTPQDVLDSNLAVGSEDIAYNHDFFATSDDPAIRGIFNKKMAPDKKRKKRPFFTPEEGLKMVKKGGFAFQVDTATAYKIIEETFEENEICELQEIYLFEPKHTATGVARHSPFKKMVTYGMRQIMEHGTPKRMRTIWAHRRPQCPESHSSIPVPVAIEEFTPALFLLICGCAFALFVMFLEKLSIHLLEKTFDEDEKNLQTRGSSDSTETRKESPPLVLYPDEFS